MRDNIDWTPELEEQIDLQFIQRVIDEVTTSCALPISIPNTRIPEYIMQAAQWFWMNVDMACEERYFVIKNTDIKSCDKLNKSIILPPQILGVFGCTKLQDNLRYGTMGDFSLERMMMSTYSMYGGVGMFGGGMGPGGGTGYTLTDATIAMYELSTFDQYINPPLSYNFNMNSHRLTILGALQYSDLVVQAWVRCRIQDLYNNYYFFRLVVCYVKRSLSTIYGTFEFKLPGGVTINYSEFKSDAMDEIESIKEWAENTRACDYFMMPKTS